MDPIFRLQIRVAAEVVDAHRHVNNVAYVQWMQDAAIGHATACGGTRLAKEIGGSWFVRMHRIEYLKPAFLNDEITILTWVADWRKVRSLRRYRFIRSSDQGVLAEGETEWVFVDAASGRPRPISEQIVSVFGIAPKWARARSVICSKIRGLKVRAHRKGARNAKRADWTGSAQQAWLSEIPQGGKSRKAV